MPPSDDVPTTGGMHSLIHSILERLGRVELMLFGSGDSIDRLVTQNKAQVEQLSKLPEQLNGLENQLIAIDSRLAAVEDRVKRARTNLHLRELIALVDRVPGGWRTILVAWGAATAGIDVTLDLFGVSGLLKKILGL